MALTHAQVWQGLDRLAARLKLSASGLARLAGLDPTSFNRSKRASADGQARPRWPSTESLSRVLTATGIDLAEFAALAEGRNMEPGIPLIGLAQAGADGYFDDAGFPVGQGWERVTFPGVEHDGVYALEISGDSMAPLYRHGDRIVVDPAPREVRRGDRVVVKTGAGEVMAKEVVRITEARLELRSLNPEHAGRSLDRAQVAWLARILWASQ